MTSRYQKFCFNWSKKRINNISLRSFFEKCSLQNKIMKLKKLKCSSWLNRVEFFDIMLKTLCFLFKCWLITLISIRFLTTKNWTKKSTVMKKIKWFKFHIEYKSNKQNSANDSFRRFDYKSNELIIVNAITNNVNKLIINRVYVHAFNVKRNSLINRNVESSSILFSMKKNDQSSSNLKQRTKWTSKTILFATKFLKALLRIRTLILLSKQESCRQKNLCLQYKRKLFMHDSIQDHSRSKNSIRNSKKPFVSLSKKQKTLFRKKRLKKSF